MTTTHHVNDVIGLTHDIKLGFEFEHGTSRSMTGYPGGQLYVDMEGQPYLVYIWDGWKSAFTTNRGSFYAQDRWRLTERVTIDPGMRWDVNRGSTQAASNAFSTSPLAIRLGAAWDVRADHRTVVRAHAGRYYDALYGTQYELVGVDNKPGITALVTGPDQFAEISRDSFKSAQRIAPDLSQSYMDEYLAGFERELFRSFSLTGQIVRRHYRNMVGSLDFGATYLPVQRGDPGPDGNAGTADDRGLVTVFDRVTPATATVTTNLPGAFRNYTAFQIVGRKRFSENWQALAAYTWSRTGGNFSNSFHSNARIGAGFGDPNAQINNTGPTAYDTPHELKLEGTYRVPLSGGFNMSAVYRFHSGYAWGRTIRVFDLTQGLEFVRVEPRGTRRLPAPDVLDIRIEKTVDLQKSGTRIGLFIDVFNITNQGAPDPTAYRPVIDFSGASFGRPDSWLDPRTARAAVRLTF